MKKGLMAGLVLCLLALLGGLFLTSFEDGRDFEDATAIEAYIYGYPLVTMEMTRRVSTNVEEPEGDQAPMGQFVHLRKYPDPSFKRVTAPNADTLYSVAWVDLANEPYILSLPNENGRFYLMPLLSAWTDVFEDPGTRTTGTREQKYIITGPNWEGVDFPQGVKEYKSPTNLVWILGRTYSTGTAEDYAAVHAIQDQYKLTPLSAYGKSYIPPKGQVEPKIDMTTPVRKQVNDLDIESYFNLLAQLMVDNPPASTNAPILKKMKKIGIEPGKQFELSSFSSTEVDELKQVPKIAQKEIALHAKKAGALVNGWLFSTKTGTYGTDYLQRAYIALVGLGANRPEDAMYPTSAVDAEGNPYDGANKYVLRFPKGKMPPVKGFWSLTMYNDEYYFAENPIHRYSLGSKDALMTNSDGSTDIYIQHESPGEENESNWLPAPAGPFILMFRFYAPEKALLEGGWRPPGVEKTH